jgi:hypothetical protein
VRIESLGDRDGAAALRIRGPGSGCTPKWRSAFSAISLKTGAAIWPP